MARGDRSLVDEIESDALNDSVSVATALRKCVSLGGRSGSEALRDWATRELQGYTPEDDLPSYRIVPAPFLIDAVRGNMQITGQQYPASALPDAVKGRITEQMKLYDGAGQIAALLKQPEIKLQPPGASTVVRLMNLEIGDPYQQIVSLYWAVAHAAIEGVLDQIRTALTKLVAELRANMPAGEDLPSPEAANNAITFVVTGKRNKVNFTAPQASGTGASAEVGPRRPSPRSRDSGRDPGGSARSWSADSRSPGPSWRSSSSCSAELTGASRLTSSSRSNVYRPRSSMARLGQARVEWAPSRRMGFSRAGIASRPSLCDDCAAELPTLPGGSQRLSEMPLSSPRPASAA